MSTNYPVFTFLLFISSIFIFSSCSKNDDRKAIQESIQSIVGKWSVSEYANSQPAYFVSTITKISDTEFQITEGRIPAPAHSVHEHTFTLDPSTTTFQKDHISGVIESEKRIVINFRHPGAERDFPVQQILTR